ncbi:OpgC domain-containing protein [Mesorhizobium sp. WSM4906]|uniref:OpgC family protein n=1 Tax=Mesorhizobium sp. WSM4906 TaxID=3038546 RepID=UPI0024174872|nr:OpgC domain-containing protein [Mesorhizobium sp. WSM4906]WFP74451.1 OpgC domain-containing protein [Mesorhizobium sp. WSM4906]
MTIPLSQRDTRADDRDTPTKDRDKHVNQRDTRINDRDTRIDVLRALALLTIFVDHVPGTIFENLTYKNIGFSDAAEAFVLISGISVALAYGSKFKPGGRLLATLKMWRRAGVLYVTHIVITMAVIALFCATAVFAHRPELLKMINIEPLMKNTPEVLLGIVTLGHQLGYNNILPVYAALLLAAPAFVLLVSCRPVAALTVSGLLWLVAGIWQIAPPNYPEPGLWFLNPLSWQFLFNIGLAAMLHVKRGGTIPVNRWLVGFAGVYVAGAAIWVHSPLWGHITWFNLPVVIGGFDKTFLSLPRLLHILAVSYLIVALPAVSNLFRAKPDNPLAILGKRSLPVFIAGTLIAMVAQVLKLINPGGLAFDTLLIAAGIAMQFALALYLEWFAGLGPARAKPARGESARAAFGAQPVPARIGGY